MFCALARILSVVVHTDLLPCMCTRYLIKPKLLRWCVGGTITFGSVLFGAVVLLIFLHLAVVQTVSCCVCWLYGAAHFRYELTKSIHFLTVISYLHYYLRNKIHQIYSRFCPLWNFWSQCGEFKSLHRVGWRLELHLASATAENTPSYCRKYFGSSTCLCHASGT